MRSVLLAVFLALAAPAVARAADGFQVIDVARAAQLVGHPGVYVFDANTPEVFAQGHLPGAKYVHYDDYPASTLPADKGATLLFYCKNSH